jgi:hypothetical protein
LIIVVDILRRFEICRNHGDFQQCFNLGKLPGGFGSATSLHNSSLVVASKPKPAARSDRTHSSSKRRDRSPDTDRTHSSTKRRDRSPDTVAHRQPSSATLISEFIALTEAKKKLETLFTCDATDGEHSEDVEATNEKEMQNKMMRILKKRRQEIADTIDE